MSKRKFSAPGLMIYGLHKDLSSNTDDTDYEIGKEFCKNVLQVKRKRKRRKVSSQSTSSSENENEIVSKQRAKKTTRTKKKKLHTFGASYASGHLNYEDYTIYKQRAHNKGDHSPRKQKQNIRTKKSSKIKHITPPSDITWSCLPTEILSLIFHYVEDSIDISKSVKFVLRCGQVCKHWYDVVNEPVSWKTVDLAFMGGKSVAKDELITKLLSYRFSEVETLILRGWKFLTDKGLLSVGENCYKLKSLNISHCQRKTISKISADSLLVIAKNCPLEQINFSNLRAHNYSKALVSFFELCGNKLTHVNISENIVCGSSVFTAICSFCPSLLVIDISNTSIRRICFTTFQKSCPLLEAMYFSNLDLEPKTSMTMTGFQKLRYCSLGKLNYPGWLNDTLLNCITKNATELTLLDVRGAASLTVKSFQLLDSTVLERLYLSHCKMDVDMALVICDKYSDTLWDLDISKLVVRTGSFINNIVSVFTEKCKKLKHLNLAGTMVTNECILKVLLKLDLESIDITSCRSITRGLKRLYKKDEIRSLIANLKIAVQMETK